MPQSVQANARTVLGWLPVAWLCLVMLLSARGIDGSVSFLLGFTPSSSVFYFVVGSTIVGALTILWGLWLLGLAYNRSARFPRQFTLWQIAFIAALVAKQAYILLAPDFAVTGWSLAYVAAEIAVGIAMIVLVNRSEAAHSLFGNEKGESPRLVVIALFAVLGVVVGGAVGAGLGLAVGMLISELTDMSCFEGACGYFVVLAGIVGCLAGAVLGGILAAWLAARRRRSA